VVRECRASGCGEEKKRKKKRKRLKKRGKEGKKKEKKSKNVQRHTAEEEEPTGPSRLQDVYSFTLREKKKRIEKKSGLSRLDWTVGGSKKGVSGYSWAGLLASPSRRGI
jgi:hypothetical protein